MTEGEFQIIAKIKESLMGTHPGLIVGIGDDCAVLKRDETRVTLITTDCLVENIHFDLKYFSFFDLGKKALAVNLSDIAAMAGEPEFAFVTVAIPPKIKDQDIADFFQGLDQMAQQHGVAVAGGDLSASPNYLFINITLVGVARHGAYKPRSAAKAGDGIYLSGPVGLAAVGFKFCQLGRVTPNIYVQAFKNPVPRVQLGKILSECAAVHALIDVSDGLVADLNHIMEESGTTCAVELDKLPRPEDFPDVCHLLRLNAQEVLLSGGEDYQLLFTMDDSKLTVLSQKLNEHKNIKITRVGEVKEGFGELKPSVLDPYPRVAVLNELGKRLNVKVRGFDHFSR